ncbi:hypothetical protein PsYK624_084140 [Phanerochaete sordida]|uniref:Uncharacterized protein n=1 Tax=Phanerochaete sordida TaxID=48140 RepID=A0A9P3LEH6_9APHY|nr:hypothetical protein PsYK624_084140 [Phanerochaete sordida]
MVDVMMSPAVGLSKDDLKPCFLMLASCNTDLSREARKSGPEGAEAAREHMDQAKKYFQLVYGTHYPQEGSPRSGPSASPQRLSLLQRVDRRPQVGPPADEPSRMHTLERELQSLRAKHTNQVGQLADAHTARRKAEEELDVERTLRRTAGREADAELQSAQRSARFALDQCRREVEGRRRAEGRAVELHDELAAVQDRLCAQLREAQDKDRKARECFARLGTLFTKAAQGELDDPTAPMFAGPSRSARGTPMPPMPPVPPAARSSSRSTRATPPPPPLPMGPPAKRRRTESA